MHRCVGLLVFLATLRPLSAKHTESTLSVFDQVIDLKQKIRNKIYLKRPAVQNHYKIHKHSDELDNSFEYYEYVDEKLGTKLKPILEDDKHKVEGNVFLRLLKTTEEPDPKRQLPIMRRGLVNDTGYFEPASVAPKASRRNYYISFPELRDQELWWVQGRVLITPFLNGQLNNNMLMEYYRVGMKDHTFLRFMQLLHSNTTGHDISDVRTILVQISNLKLRLFLWESDAIKILLNELIDGPQHTFGRLKQGLKRQFKQWHLDTSASDLLLKESRMFRPPCINWRPGGSTRQRSRKTLTPPMPPTTRRICVHEHEGSCEKANLREGEMAAEPIAVEGVATEALTLATKPRDSDEEKGELNPRVEKKKERKGHRGKKAKRHHHKSKN